MAIAKWLNTFVVGIKLANLASLSKIHISRRQLLRYGALLGANSFLAVNGYAVGLSPGVRSSKQLLTETLLLSAASDKTSHYAMALTVKGELYYKLPIEQRAHDSLYISSVGHALYICRNPGKAITVVELINKKIIHTLHPPANRHFYGHGVIDHHQHYLYTTEGDSDSSQGYIGIYDIRQGYRRVGEFASGGIEPHQIALLPPTKISGSNGVNRGVIVVANGGLKKVGSTITNKNSFESSLVYIDCNSGNIIAKVYCQYSKNSLRHLVVSPGGTVFIGAQSYENDTVPLVFSHVLGESLTPLEADDLVWREHHQYIASLSMSGETLAATSPKGHVVSLWQARANTHSHHSSLIPNISRPSERYQWHCSHRYQDVAGIANIGQTGEFISTTGLGLTAKLTKDSANSLSIHPLRWDNHLSGPF